MKRFLTIVGLLSMFLVPAFAQEETNSEKKGSYLGVDNDPTDYLIGAPADNWFFAFGGGIQTYIGSEVEPSARWNGINPSVYLEVGKWLLPDIAVSLHLSGFDMNGQSRYSRNPFLDFTGMAANPAGYFPYRSFHAYTFALNGFVTLDWTNFIQGYERGSKRKLHILMPVGLGCAWLTGKKVNPKPDIPSPNNFELDFSAALIPEITLAENIRLVPAFRLQLQRRSLDYSAYELGENSCDFQPSVTIGLKFNLSDTKKHGTHKTRYKGEIPNHHVFVPVENSHLVSVLNSEIASLQDSLNAANARVIPVPAIIPAKEEDAAAVAAGAPSRPLSPMEEILAFRGDLSNALVYFPLASSALDLNAERRLQSFADVINNSDEDAKFYVIGAADKATGTEKINWNLSIARCKAVYNALVKEYGVYPGKLEMRPLGGIDEYTQNELNRIGIVVESNDEMTSIIDKYSKKY